MNGNHEADTNRWIDDRLIALTPESEWQPDLARGLARLRERRRAGGRIQRWAWIATAAVATAVSLAAFPVTRAFAQRCVSACASESSWVHELLVGTLPSPSLAYVKSEMRKPAPDFTLNDASGKTVTLSGFRGKVVLLNFWATWCAPCKAEIPSFIELQQTYGGRGFVALGVSMDEDGWRSVKPYMEAHRINYPVVVGNEQISRLYGGLDSIPTTFIIDKSGRIAAIHLGLCSRSEYEADIKAVLNEK